MTWLLSVTLAAGAVGYGAVWVFSSVANLFSIFSNADESVQHAVKGSVFAGSGSSMMARSWLNKFTSSMGWFDRPAAAIQHKVESLTKGERK